jgi:hypothetical protein
MMGYPVEEKAEVNKAAVWVTLKDSTLFHSLISHPRNERKWLQFVSEPER